MGSVQVTVNGRAYSVACDEGQEAHVARLGTYLEQKVGQLVKAVGQVGDARLLVMASLMITDELVDTDQALTQIKSAVAKGGPAREPVPAPAAAVAPPVAPPPPPLAPQQAPHEAVLAEALESLADRIEAIAAELEQDYL
jgi:cell division protein ZapA